MSLAGTGVEVETKVNDFVRLGEKALSVVPSGPASEQSEFAGPTSRSSKRQIVARLLEATGGGVLLRHCPTWSGVLILNYHRIGYADRSDLDRNLWSATPEDFSVQLSLLKRDYDVIGLNDLDDALHRRGRSVMITFDDGYRDNYLYAFPALKQHDLSATFFVATGFLDQPSVPWWDEIAWMVRHAKVSAISLPQWFDGPLSTEPAKRETTISRLLKIYKSLAGGRTASYQQDLAAALQTERCPTELGQDLWMTWDMVREMRAEGMIIGGHSVTHPVLSNVSAEQQDFEVGESRRRLVAELGEPIDAFSYPVGGDRSFNQVTADALHRHGYRWGFTYRGGYIPRGKFDPYALNRAAIEADVDFTYFRALTTLPQFFA